LNENEIDEIIQLILKQEQIQQSIKTSKLPKEKAELQEIYNFLFTDEETALSIDEVFGVVQEEIKKVARDVMYSKQKFLAERHRLNGEQITTQALNNLYQDIEATYKKRSQP
jgi:hypothetical protein